MSSLMVHFGETEIGVTMVWFLMFITYAGSFVNLFLPKKWYFTLIILVSFSAFSTLAGFYAWEIANNIETIREVFAGEIFYYILAIVPLSALVMIAFGGVAFLLKQRVFGQIVGAISVAALIVLNVWYPG